MKLAQDSLRLQPGNPAILDTIGWIYYRKEDFNQAHGFIERALAGAPDSPILNYHMGMVLFKNGDAGQAREKLEKALGTKEDFYGRSLAEETLSRLKDKS